MRELSLTDLNGISHRIYFKSSENMDEVRDNSIQCIVTSPPYGDLKNYNVEGQIGYKQNYEDYLSRLENVWRECFRVLKKDGSLWINVNSKMYKQDTFLIPLDIIKSLNKIGFFLKDILIWHKSSGIPSGGKGLSQHFEYILFLVKDKNNFKFRKNTFTVNDYKIEGLLGLGNIWNIKKKAGSIGKKTPHPAIYPMEMVRRIVKLSTDKFDTILDPFLGSGTNTLVAKELVRNSIGYELNEKDYRPLIKERLERNIII